MANCTKCGASLRDGARFCGACGAKIEVQRFCTECGEKLEPGEHFCPQCGTPAEGGSVFQISAAPPKLQETDPSYFEVEDCFGGCCIKHYTGPEENVVIPSRVGGKKVVEIGLDPFACWPLTSITIPFGVVRIRERSFAEQKTLASITIPDSVTEIGEGAFSGCEDLASLVIPLSVTKIGEGAFSGCESLTSITIPAGVTEIGSRMFHSCKRLTSITIPNSVKKIGDSAFYGCTRLTSITIPASVTEIGEEAIGPLYIYRPTIHAPAGSFAEQYARKSNLPFQPL